MTTKPAQQNVSSDISGAQLFSTRVPSPAMSFAIASPTRSAAQWHSDKKAAALRA
ncbi:MAG: hypothetical protein OXF51_07390 [Alphaproteobacteria bacterium]|nr:hypothetical protein [Alphaproteobacteria bacterium]